MGFAAAAAAVALIWFNEICVGLLLKGPTAPATAVADGDHGSVGSAVHYIPRRVLHLGAGAAQRPR
jgi:hypothetical protein